MDAPSLQQLMLENERLRDEIARRDRRIEQLEKTIRDLQKRLEESSRSSKRQAAPFSKGDPKKEPETPGRKSGDQHGKHGHRPPPTPEQIDEVHEAKLPDACPDCGGGVVEDHLDEQFQTEIPRKPIIRKFNIHCGHCDKCGKNMRGRHELQTSDATGAAASQLGPDAQAAIVYLNKHAGMSYGKIADAFDKIIGIEVQRGACAQIVLRAAERLAPAYQEIEQKIIDSKHITPDETGWRIGGVSVWLHGWVGDDGATLYAIDPRRSAEVLEEVIGIDWSGHMTHDGFSSYDRFGEAIHQQCVDHVLRRARALLEKQIGHDKLFPGQVIDLFTDALKLRDRLAEEGVDANRPADAERLADAYETYTRRLEELTARPRVEEANERLRKHLANHSAEWFVFLGEPGVPATNYLGEQAMRPPIVNRKVWGGNRTDDGAEAQEVDSSVIQTCKNTAINAVNFISEALCGTVSLLFA